MKLLTVFFVLIHVASAQPYWGLLNANVPGSISGITQTLDSTLFLSSWFGGTFRSTNSGASWEKMDVYPVEVFDIVSDSHDNVFVASPSIPNIYRSRNYGYTWEKTGDSASWCYSLAVSATDVIYGGTSTGGVFRSSNDGDTWNSIGLAGYGGLWYLDVTGNGDIYTSDGLNLFRSTDKGNTWDDLTYKVPDRNFLSISAGASGTVYVGAYRPDGHILASSDRGETWREMRTINFDIHVVGVVEMDNGDLIAATEDYLVWRSTDGGDTWSGFWDGLNQSPTCIYQSRNGRVFLGASGAIYELMDYPVSTGAPTSPLAFSLAQSYPNPVSTGQSAYINFSLPSQQHVTLTVYNTSGQEVATLAHGTYQPGTHTAQCNTAGLPAGVYVYRLIAGDKQESKLMQVVR